MALVATFGNIVTQPRALQLISKIFTDLSMSWLEGFARRGWVFGTPSPAPHMSFEEPPTMEGVQFAAGELYQLLLPGLSCAAIPLIAVGLWTVLGWLGRAVWFTGWILSWVGWIMSGCPCPKRSGSILGGFGSAVSTSEDAAPKTWTSSSTVIGGAGLAAVAAMPVKFFLLELFAGHSEFSLQADLDPDWEPLEPVDLLYGHNLINRQEQLKQLNIAVGMSVDLIILEQPCHPWSSSQALKTWCLDGREKVMCERAEHLSI